MTKKKSPGYRSREGNPKVIEIDFSGKKPAEEIGEKLYLFTLEAVWAHYLCEPSAAEAKARAWRTAIPDFYSRFYSKCADILDYPIFDKNEIECVDEEDGTYDVIIPVVLSARATEGNRDEVASRLPNQDIGDYDNNWWIDWQCKELDVY